MNSGIFRAPKKIRITNPISSISCIPIPINNSIAFILFGLIDNKSSVKIICIWKTAVPSAQWLSHVVQRQLAAPSTQTYNF